MATPNHEGQTETTPTDASSPVLRLRFDPPSAEDAPQLDNVISDVEQLSLGIDAMLRRASTSSVGAIASHAAIQAMGDDDQDEDDEAGVLDDEPMMAMFDEEEPSDIHAIDRMLASQAEQLVTAAAPESTAIASAAPMHEAMHEVVRKDAGAAEEQEIVLEGEFEDIGSLLASAPPMIAAPATSRPPAPEPVNASLNQATTAIAGALAEAIDASPLGSHAPAAPAAPASPAATSETRVEPDRVPPPPPVLDLSLAPTQAQGIAAALAAAAAGNPARIVAESQPVAESAPVTASPTVSEHTPVAPASAVVASCKPTAPAVAEPRKPLFSSIAQQVMEVLALTNLPMRMLPPGLRPAINMLAVSLALWAPAVMALGPRIAAARQDSHAAAADSEAAHAAPKHEESGHGGSGAAPKRDAAKTSTSKKKSAASSKKSSSKKSSAAKADTSHSSGH